MMREVLSTFFVFEISLLFVFCDVNDVSPCGRVPTVSDGYATGFLITIIKSDFGESRSDVATFTCNSGASMAGSATVVCDGNSRRWGALPTCQRVTTTTTSTKTTTTTRKPTTTAPTTTTTTRTTPRTTPAQQTTQPASINGLSNARRGSQCKYGFQYPHDLCQPDSSNLVSLEKLSIAEAVDRHNFYRREVAPLAQTMPMLQWDDDLATEAERWAATCPTTNDEQANRKLPARGSKEAWDWVNQNIYWYKGANVTVTAAIDSWAAEKSNWYYGIKNPSNPVGHYTQIISARTLYVGCGKSYCQGAKWEYNIVCQYGPGGNWDNNGNYFANPYVALGGSAGQATTARQAVTVPTATTRSAVIQQQQTGNTAGFTNPLRGAQCKYGLSKPHSMCLDDSPRLASLEPASISEILNRHNYYRGRVSPPARSPLINLAWDDDLAIEAERWAAQCKFEHSSGDVRALPAQGNKPAWSWVGQNLCWSSGFNQTWTQCIDDWGSEVKDWQYGVGRTSGNTVGHYTQIIWADTLYVGCGKSRCRRESGSGEENNLVCHYGPGGNVGINGADPYVKPYKT